MNIRVDLETPIIDGTEVVFRSPVDCSQITGLIVYYKENGNTTSKEFALADAHGNNVGDIDHLFAENVVVKVILDLRTNMAFVQNADTNAYIERTFVKTVNGVSPDANGNVTVAGGGSGNDYVLTEADKEEIAQLVIEKLPIYNCETEDVTIISFTVDGEYSYQAEEGMTWLEWVNSEYNTGCYGELFAHDEYYDTVRLNDIDYTIASDGTPVKGSNIIISGYAYETV